jgi:hypothetical protein
MRFEANVTEDSFLAMTWLEVADQALEHMEAAWLLTLTALWPNRDNATPWPIGLDLGRGRVARNQHRWTARRRSDRPAHSDRARRESCVPSGVLLTRKFTCDWADGGDPSR